MGREAKMKVTSSYSIFIRCALGLLLGTLNARGDTRPDWIDHPQGHGVEFKHYIGRATHAPSDSDAVFLATSIARKQAILTRLILF
jgi:hypothetical protein